MDCKSLTRGWIFLSLYKVVVDPYILPPQTEFFLDFGSNSPCCLSLVVFTYLGKDSFAWVNTLWCHKSYNNVTSWLTHSLCESFKFLQDRRSGESRYFTRPYTILPDRQILCDYAKLWCMYIKLILLLLQNTLHCFNIKYIQTVRSFCNFLRTNFRFFTRRQVPFVEKIYQPDSKFTSKNWRSCDFRIDWTQVGAVF